MLLFLKKIQKLIYLIFLSNIKYARWLGVKIGNDCRLVGVVKFGSEPYLVSIGNHVSITSSSFITHDGGLWVFRENHPNIDLIKPIKIGNNVFIGSNSTILPGITIGNNVIVGANSVVTKDLESGFIYAGIPAKKIKSIEEYWKKNSSDFINTKQLNSRNKKIFLKQKYNL